MNWIKGYTYENNYKLIEEPPYDNIKDWVMDKLGWFLIKVEDNKIHCAFSNTKKQILFSIKATRPQQIYHYICNILKLELRPDHLAYLGKELDKAQWCIEKDYEYVQDNEILQLDKYR